VACGHRRAELAPDRAHADSVYGDDYFEGGGAGYPRYLGEARILRATGRYYTRLAACHMSPGSVLDVGAAAGFILESFTRAGWRGTGIEPNRAMAAYARETLGLDVRRGTLEDFETTDRYDLVTMIQVLPHLWHLDRALSNAAALTRPGGWWLIETWARDSWTARLMGRRWHEYSPPSVLHWFTRDGVARLAARYGFHQVAIGHRIKRLRRDHALSLLAYETQDTRASRLVGAVGRLLPAEFPYPSEDLFWVLLRKDETG
jgi:SAM-dependent methyltransferase